MERMAAIQPSERPYLLTRVLDLYRHRVVWLLLLMISASFTGAIITYFEDALGRPGCPHRLHSYAHGHRRQLRQPVLGHRHPEPLSGGAPV